MAMKEKQEQWRRHIEACTSSGLSIHEWCKVNSISSDQYHYWKKKFNKLASSKEDKTQWAPLVIQNPKKSSASAQPITLQTGNLNIGYLPLLEQLLPFLQVQEPSPLIPCSGITGMPIAAYFKAICNTSFVT